jgi:benzoyl-CoA 2,3-dioxygenase component B
MVRKLGNFDDWKDYFKYWQDSIGLPPGALRTFAFDAKFGDPEVSHIEFGHYKGQRKWPTVMHIPDQRIRDALLNLIVYQGDTEFASVEQQRNLLHHAPSDYDLLSLQRVMTEEMRHGWQMSYLLCQHFGDEGKREAAKLLERRADEGERLLGSFNEIVDNWLDFFTYTQFIDRDGKFQLKMLSVSAFDPLSRSMGPMLKEESYHLGTGNNGLLRIVKAGKMPAEVMQRFFYKWIPTAFDLFGTDNSSSAHWAYVWGLKGRYDERENPTNRGGGRRAGQEQVERNGAESVPPGDRQARRAAQPLHPRARAAAQGPRSQVQPADRPVRPSTIQCGWAADRQREVSGVPRIGAPAA